MTDLLDDFKEGMQTQESPDLNLKDPTDRERYLEMVRGMLLLAGDDPAKADTWLD